MYNLLHSVRVGKQRLRVFLSVINIHNVIAAALLKLRSVNNIFYEHDT